MFSNFDLSKLENKYQHKRWKRAVYKGRGNDYDFLLNVLADAENGYEIKKIGSKYYSCAKFVRDFYLPTKYKFRKEEIWLHTCCRAYPNICHGKCCCDDIGAPDCNCENIPTKNIVHIDNCYNDGCKIFKFQPKNHKKFNLLWITKLTS